MDVVQENLAIIVLETTLFLRRAVIAINVFVVHGRTDAGPKLWTIGDVGLVAAIGHPLLEMVI